MTRGRVLLHSAVDADGCGRYSFAAEAPACVIEARGDEIVVTRGGRKEQLRGDALEMVERLAREYGAGDAGAGDGPEPVAIGTLSYDYGRALVLGERGRRASEPDVWFGFYEDVERFEGPDADADADADGGRAPRFGALRSEGDQGYSAAIERILEYVRAGDCYQVNLSRRLSAEVLEGGDAFALYRELARVSPAPYGAVIERGESTLISGSPERFLYRAAGSRRLETRPIKGTRPRGRTAEEDAALRAELLASAKDEAEHLMIVDLERNDLGRVADFGSVAVEGYRRVVTLAGVHHLVSTVSCETDAGFAEIMRATFPGGSITGAPKKRAMEIIDELESGPRGAYTGCVGYIGKGGALDFAITIRSAVLSARLLELSVGGGVVSESTAAAEFLETEDKAKGWRLALEPWILRP